VRVCATARSRWRKAWRWIEETTRKYHVTVEVADVTETHGKTVVTAFASGNLPGSPAQLYYAFILEGGKVARLELH